VFEFVDEGTGVEWVIDAACSLLDEVGGVMGEIEGWRMEWGLRLVLFFDEEDMMINTKSYPAQKNEHRWKW